MPFMMSGDQLDMMRDENGELMDAPKIEETQGIRTGDTEDRPDERPVDRMARKRADVERRRGRSAKPISASSSGSGAQQSFGTLPVMLGEYTPGTQAADRQSDSGYTRVEGRQRGESVVPPTQQEPDPLDPYAPYINRLNSLAGTYNEEAASYRETGVRGDSLDTALVQYLDYLREAPEIPGASEEYNAFRSISSNPVAERAEFDRSPSSYYNPFTVSADNRSGTFAQDLLSGLSDQGAIDPRFYDYGEASEYQFEPGAERFNVGGQSVDLPGYSPAGLSWQYRQPAYDPFGDRALNTYWGLESEDQTSAALIPDAPYVIQGYGNRFAPGASGNPTTFDPRAERTSLGRNPTPGMLDRARTAQNRSGLIDQRELASIPLSESKRALLPGEMYEVARGFDQGQQFRPEDQYVGAGDQLPENFITDNAIEYGPQQSPDSRLFSDIRDLRISGQDGGEALDPSGRESELAFLGGDVDYDVTGSNLDEWWQKSLQTGQSPDTLVHATDVDAVSAAQQRLSEVSRPWRQQDEFDIPALPQSPEEIIEEREREVERIRIEQRIREEQRIRVEQRQREVFQNATNVNASVRTQNIREEAGGAPLVYLGNTSFDASGNQTSQFKHSLGAAYPQDNAAPILFDNRDVEAHRPPGHYASSYPWIDGPRTTNRNLNSNWINQVVHAGAQVSHPISGNLANNPVYSLNNQNYVQVGQGGFGGLSWYWNPDSVPSNYSGQRIGGTPAAFNRNANSSYTGQNAGQLFGRNVTENYNVNVPYTAQVPYNVEVPYLETETYEETLPGTPTLNGEEVPDAAFSWSSPGEDGLRRLLFGDQRVDQSDIRAFAPENAPAY